MLTGSCAKNKGMALFPRKVGGKYAMVARLDNENLYYMESDDVRDVGQRPSAPAAKVSRGR